MAPATSRAALLFNPQTSPGGESYYSRPIEAAAAALGIQLTTMPVHTVSDVEPAVKSFAGDPNGCLVVLSDIFSVVNRKLIIGLAAAISSTGDLLLPIFRTRWRTGLLRGR